MTVKKAISLFLAALIIVPPMTLQAAPDPRLRLLEPGSLTFDGSGTMEARRRRNVDADSGDSASDATDETPDPEKVVRRKARVRPQREHKVLVGLVVPSAIAAVLGLVLTVDGFRHNPDPQGSTTLSWSKWGTNYIDAWGTYKVTGKGGVYLKQIQFTASNGVGSTLFNYSYYPYKYIDEGSSATWYYYNNYNTQTPSVASLSASTFQTSDGGYAMNNALEGTVGVVLFALGIVGTILGLTHTQEVMADNNIDLQLQQVDANQMRLAVSKGF